MDGKAVRRLQEGSYFGEITLLRDGIRTATVIEQDRTHLYALDRDQFLTALTRHPHSAAAATSVVEARLAAAAAGRAMKQTA